MSDLLLEWMSFRNEGRLDDLPAELAASPPRRLLDDFSMLGHLEMTGSSSWRVAPPVLASLARHGGDFAAGVLCGARTPGLLARVADASGKHGSGMSVTPVPDRPSIVRIVAPSVAALADVAVAAGIHLQDNAGYTLLACLPTIGKWPRRPCPMVAGRVETVRRFSGSRTKWIEFDPRRGHGCPERLFPHQA